MKFKEWEILFNDYENGDSLLYKGQRYERLILNIYILENDKVLFSSDGYHSYKNNHNIIYGYDDEAIYEIDIEHKLARMVDCRIVV